ncbi:MAG: hypothetical protein JWQ14_617, partial [Adhaeribacter sp.]|nr:hypothetical protein [Adhaeribacter sp.]
TETGIYAPSYLYFVSRRIPNRCTARLNDAVWLGVHRIGRAVSPGCPVIKDRSIKPRITIFVWLGGMRRVTPTERGPNFKLIAGYKPFYW